MLCVLPLKCVDVFLPSSASLFSSLQGIGTTEYRLTVSLRNTAAFYLHFCPKIHPVCDRKFRTTSFQIQAVGKTNDREGIYDHTVQLSLNCFHIFHRNFLHPTQCRHTVILPSSVESD